MRRWTLAMLVASCAQTAPPNVLPPPDGADDCATAAANLARLGGCGLEPKRIEQDCRDAERAERRIDLRFPVGCLTVATTCDDAAQCR